MVRTVPVWLRVFFVLNVIQDLALASGLVAPESIPFPLTVTPLNARFIGALYLASAIGITLSAIVRNSIDTRIFVVGFGLVSLLVLIVTLLYWVDFTARRVPVLWLVTYAVDPIVTTFAVAALHLWRPGQPGRHRLSTLFLAQFVVFGAIGLALLLAPDGVAAIWPWKISPLLARVYGCFFIAYAIGGWLASGEARPAAILPITASSFALMAFVIVASALHLPRFTPGLPTVVWFGAFGIGAIAFAAALMSFRWRESGSRGPGLPPVRSAVNGDA